MLAAVNAMNAHSRAANSPNMNGVSSIIPATVSSE